MDTDRLRNSWAKVAAHGTQVPQFFYARLFLAHPELRDMFPASMATQSDRLVAALGRFVSEVDDLTGVTPILEQLGRDHRRFSVRAEHYPLVGETLLATLRYFLGSEWGPELAEDWTAAYTVVANVMSGAAAAAEGTSPPWWEAEIIAHERRGYDVALLRLRPDAPYVYRAGQSVAVETSTRPRLWRTYSIANAPRADSTLDLHVKAVSGGQVSNALVNTVEPGDTLRLGAPVGKRLTTTDDSGRDLLMLAGGTGLAPLKAVVEELAATERPRRVTLFAGARTEPDLYDLKALRDMESRLPWLTVTPVLSHDPYFAGERGAVTEVALRHGRWRDHDIYACGPDDMVSDAVIRLVAAGVPTDRIRTEDFEAEPYRSARTAETATREVSAP
ncbi:globin domain-containing protein [Virgisporangium aurantiacum]|uniref:nitric oxide dioxygenase n=1 Tax=Virgisporangium aurantiacum TaxID=175570 RepID=A0A8J4E9E7_9ACTN|nr:globin domain-containing protein [Virgisporangium aurantiacum]GIJ63657.1 flavohemoprotein [Virgisporangium aurantiacum]